MKRQVVQDIAPEWNVTHTGMLECPHGNRIEDDGEGPCGCESPLLQAGLI